MSKVRKEFIISVLFLLIFCFYTFLVKTVDVDTIGPNSSEVGLATINEFFKDLIGKNETWYKITKYITVIPIFMVFIYAVLGFKQLIQRKSLFKVDKELFGLGIFYVVVIGLYVFFEVFIVNYRPVLMEGELEASYPSSHTLLALCLCGSSILLNRMKYNKYPISKIVNPILWIVMVVLVVGRLLSGVHWFSDILGGIIISTALIMFYYTYLKSLEKNRVK